MLSSSNELYGRTAALVLLAIYTTPIVAGDLDITPRIRVGAIYTDNLRLDPSNEEKDAAAELTPGISLRADGNRLDASLDYQMENYTFLKNSNANNTAHQLNATAAAELAKNFLFLDASSVIGQAVIDGDERISLNNFNTSGNRTDFYSYTLSPYMQNHFGGYANGVLRYTYSQLGYDDEGTSDSTRNGVDAGLVSGRRFKQVAWRVNYSYNDIDYDESFRQNDKFENADGEIRHGLSKEFSLVAQAGWSNDDLSTGRNVETGTYWAVGGFWQPSRFWSLEALAGKNLTTASVGLYPTVRTSLLVNYRDRDVGLNPGERWTVDFKHRTRRTVWNAEYLEDTTTEQQRQRETSNTFFGVDPISGEPNPDPQPGDVDVPVQNEIISLSGEVEERKRASGSFRMNTGRSGVRVTIFNETRDVLNSGIDERTQGVNGSWNRRLASRTNTILSGSFQRLTGDDRDDRDFWYINASLIRRISRKLTGTLEYRFTRQDSDNDQNDYDENHVIARLTATF